MFKTQNMSNMLFKRLYFLKQASLFNTPITNMVKWSLPGLGCNNDKWMLKLPYNELGIGFRLG